MWHWLAKTYARRMVNVNVNILAAGIIALVPVLLVVKGYHVLGLDNRWLPLVTFFADVTCDVTIYYVLHFLANHTGRPKGGRIHTIADASVEHVPFFRDATKVQLQRMVLSPLLYGLWLGAQWVLIQELRWHPVSATAVGFVIGVGTTRLLHTLWMLREQRALACAARVAAPVTIVPGTPAGQPREKVNA
jgi:hypothetical protein